MFMYQILHVYLFLKDLFIAKILILELITTYRHSNCSYNETCLNRTLDKPNYQ